MPRSIAMTMVATLTAAVFLPFPQAIAMEFRNCLGSEILISIHDNENGYPISSGAPGTPLGVNETRHFVLDGNLYLVKVFRLQGDEEKFVFLRSDLPGDGGRYMVHRSGAHYSIKAGDECTNPQPLAVRPTDGAPGPAHGQAPFASIMLDSGIWVSGSTTGFRVTGFDGYSFKLKLSPGSRKALGLSEQTAENAWSTYTLAGRDTYRDETGNVFIMRARHSALWNGIPHRYSWLE